MEEWFQDTGFDGEPTMESDTERPPLKKRKMGAESGIYDTLHASQTLEEMH